MNQALDLQVAFQIAMSIVAALGGWMVKGLFDKIGDLEKGMTALNVNLPTNYVRKDELTKQLDNLFDAVRGLRGDMREAIDRIETQIDRKLDKP